MNRKWVAGLGAAALLLLCASSASQSDASEPSDRLVAALRLIRAHAATDVDEDELIRAGIEAMLAKVPGGAGYLEPQSDADMAGSIPVVPGPNEGGIGASLQGRDGRVYIVEVALGGGAERAGIRSGDLVVSIDGKAVENLGDAMRRLRGQLGSQLGVTVQSVGSTTPRSVTITRTKIDTALFGARLVGDGIGFVRLEAFLSGEAERLERALGVLASKQALKGIVLDLRRGDAFFVVEEVAAVAEMFLPAGPLFTRVPRSGEARVYVATRGDPWKSVPLMALVGAKSGGGAELLAAVLKQRGRARLVGTDTSGVAMAHELFELPGSHALRLPTSHLRVGDGPALFGHGVRADVVVASTEDASHDRADPALEKALALLSESTGA